MVIKSHSQPNKMVRVSYRNTLQIEGEIQHSAIAVDLSVQTFQLARWNDPLFWGFSQPSQSSFLKVQGEEQVGESHIVLAGFC